MTSQQKKNILILGGGGFIGSHFVERYCKKYNITVFDKKYFSRKNIQSYKNCINVVEGDFQKSDDWLSSVQAADYILHLVWSTLPENADTVYDIESNVIPTLKLLEILKNSQDKKLVFVSSGGTVYGNSTRVPMGEQDPTAPICSYGLTKLTIEKYLYLYHYLYGLDYHIARLSNPYGERQERIKSQGLIAWALACAVRSLPLTVWGDGSVKRDYIYIGDAVECIFELFKYSGPERVFNVSTGIGYTINEVIAMINEISGKKMRVDYVRERKFDIKENVLSNTLANEKLSWQPKTGLKEGITLFYNYLLSKSA